MPNNYFAALLQYIAIVVRSALAVSLDNTCYHFSVVCWSVQGCIVIPHRNKYSIFLKLSSQRKISLSGMNRFSYVFLVLEIPFETDEERRGNPLRSRHCLSEASLPASGFSRAPQ
jgi:hypothetical protein